MGTSIGEMSWMMRADATRLSVDIDTAKKMLLAAGNAGTGGKAPGIFNLAGDIDSAKKGMTALLKAGDTAGAGALANRIGVSQKRLDALLGKGPGKGGAADDLAAEKMGLLSPRATAPVRLAAKALTDPLGALTAVMSKLGPEGEIAAIAMETLSTIFGKMISLAGAASPQAMERYNEVFQDLNAVIGRLFVPVLEMTTAVVRDFADFLNTILPSSADVMQSLAPLNVLIQEFRNILIEFAPEFKAALIIGLQIATPLLQMFGAQLLAVARIAAWFLRLSLPVLALQAAAGQLGITGGGLSSSLGAGQQIQARFTSAADLERSAQIAAFSSGTARSAQEQTADNTERMRELMEAREERERENSNANRRANEGFSGSAS